VPSPKKSQHSLVITVSLLFIQDVIISEDEDSEGGTEEGKGDEGKGDSSLCLTPPALSDEEPEEPKSRPR
jgi:hypothetical protein